MDKVEGKKALVALSGQKKSLWVMNDLIFFLINDLIFFLRLDTAQEMDQTVNGLLDEDEDTRRLFQFR